MAFDAKKVDLGSLSQVTPDSEVDDEFNIGNDNLDFTMGEAVKVNPDEHAKVKDLSRQSGVPEFAVAGDPAAVEQEIERNQFDFSNLRDTNPHTAGYLENYDNAITAQDDIDVLAEIENIFDPGKTFKNIGESIGVGFEAQARGLQLTGVDTTADRVQDLIPIGALPPGITIQQTQAMSMDFAERMGITSDEQLVQAKTEATDKLLTELRELQQQRAELTPEDLNLLEEGVRAGVESLGNMAPGAALMLLSGGRAAPLLGTIGVQTFGASYGDARAEGLTPQESAWFAGIDAAIEVGTELLPTGTLETILTGKSTGLKKEALKFMVREMGTEQLATLGQSLNSLAFGLDEQLANAETTGEMVEIQLRRQAVTAIATVVAGGAQVAAATGLRKSLDALTKDEIQKDTQAQVEQNQIDALNAQSEKSKLRERDKESFKQFVDEADGNQNSTVFIDGAQTSLYLQSKTPEEIESDPALTLLSDQAREASELGTDVQVPVADFAADIAGTDTYTELRDSMTMSAETTSPFRQEQQEQETQAYVRTLMDEAQENTSEYVEAQEIYTQVRDQLIDTGAVNAANASTMAQVVPAWATAQARRQGKTVQQVYQDSGLIVEGPQTGERARLEGEQVLEQRGVTTADLQTTLQSEGVDVQLRGEGDVVTLDKIVVLEEQREVGIGTGAMQRIIDWADANGKTVALSPSKDFGGAVGRLKEFYKGLGFVENKGRNKDLEISETMFYTPKQPLRQEGITDEQITRRPEEADREEAAAEARAAQQETIDRAKARDDAEALAEFNRAKSGQRVTFTHRSPDDFIQFDDTLLGQNTTTPSGNLGHYLSAADVGNVDRYGNELSVHEFTFENPLVIAAETFEEVMTGLTAEEVMERREALMEMGHDGVLVEDLNWAIAFEGSTLNKLEEDVEMLLAQRTNGEKPEARGYYDPANSVIRLTEAADLSTFLHEFAHFMYEMEVNGDTEMLQSINNWYKRNAEDVAKEAMTYDTGVTILPKHVEQYLDDGAVTEPNYDEATNERVTKAVRRSVHEQFARGFETYLMEGKAPSIELRNAFRAFARWLSQIYQAFRNQLKVDLDAEMRQVFDRLLATEEQIAAAEARGRVEPMFTDAAMAGMTEEEFSDYQERQAKVKDVQSETLRDKLIKQLTRQTKAWWKEEKQDIIDEEIDTLNTEQVYVARNRLRDGDIKLDHATVKDMVGEEKTNKLGRTSVIIPPKLVGTTAKGQEGIHPDQAAAFFGYSSGAEMLNDLSTAPNIKVQADVNAEKRMNDKYGNILTDGTIEAQADEAVQSEERGKLILHELKMLARGTNAPTVDRATIKALAEERIGRLSFRQIHPGKYRKAEINAAQEAVRMLAEGNKEGAAAAKMKQVMNYYLGLSATNAKIETIKIVDRMSRYNKKKVREEIQKAEGGFWDQITKILNRFEFKKSATLSAVENINTWVRDRNENEGDGLVLTTDVLNESYVTHWKNVPFTGLQGINDSVKNIEHVARYSNKIVRLQEEIDFNKLVDRWVTSMNDKVKTRFVSKRTDVVEGRKWGRWFMAQMTKIPYLASWLDGGERAGISHDIMVQPFTDAYNAEIKLWDKSGKPVMEAIDGRSKEDLKRHNTKYYVPEIDDNLFGHQMIAVALNTGNQSNLKKMLLGEGWANPDVDTDLTFENPKLQAVLARLTKSDWELVQLIWDQMNTLYPQLAEVHRQTTGLTPPKIESQPVETEFGTFRGGYYPVKYDPNRSHKAQMNEDKLNAEVDSMFSNSASIQVSVNTGTTNERTGYYAPIRLSLDVVSAHFQETIHYITHHEPVREVNKLTRDKRVAETIKEKLGPEEYAQIKPWLNDIAKDGRESPTKMFWDDMLQRLRFGVTLGVMGFKASTGIIQISGLSNTVAEVGLSNVMQAARTILGSTTTIKSAWDFAVENSNVLEHRTQTMDREIKNAMKRIEGNRGVLAAAQEASMKHIALIQTYMVDLPSWHAAYIKGMQDWGDETRAFKYADWVIENVQGSGATKDMARIMRGQSETGRMFTMFMTFFSSLWNMERDLVKGARTGRYSTTSVAAKAMFLFTIPVLFEMMMRGELGEPEDGDDDRLQRMLTNSAMFPIQSIPFIRDIASATTGEFGYNISPLQSIIEQGTQTIPEIVKRGFTDDEITKGQVKGATKFIGATVGIPGVNQAWATGEHLYDVIEDGEEFTVHQLLFGPKRQ